MKKNNQNIDTELRGLMKKGVMEVPHADFENKVMEKIELVHLGQKIIQKNLKASWVFLIASILLFPLGYIILFNHLDLSIIPGIGDSVGEIMEVALPAGVLLFSVVVLLQIDNLLRLTVRTRFS